MKKVYAVTLVISLFVLSSCTIKRNFELDIIITSHIIKSEKLANVMSS